MTPRSLTHFRRSALSLAFSLSSIGAALAQVPIGPPPSPPTAPPVAIRPAKHLIGPPGVAAVVNGQTITKAQVETLAFQLGGPEILDRLINNMLVDQEAKRLGITTTPAEIDQRLAEVKQQIAKSPQGGSLDTLLSQNHETMANFRDSLRLRLEADKISAKTLPAITLVHVRHLLVLNNNPGGGATLKVHTDAEAKDLIAKAQAELKSGKSFDEVAKKYSEDPSNKDKGGDLGILGPMGLYNPQVPGQPFTPVDPAFSKAALALKKGETTPTPVKSVYGYHLIQAVSTSSAPLNAQEKAEYAAAASAAQQAELQQQVPALLQSLRQRAKISNYLVP